METALSVGIIVLSLLAASVQVALMLLSYRGMKRRQHLIKTIRQRERVVHTPDPLNQTQFQQTINQAYNGSLYE